MLQYVTKLNLPLFSTNNLMEMPFVSLQNFIEDLIFTLNFNKKTDLVDEALKSTIPRHKIIFGLPLFGTSYKLKLYYRSKVGDLTSGLGKPGEYNSNDFFVVYLIFYINRETNSKIWILILWRSNYKKTYLLMKFTYNPSISDLLQFREIWSTNTKMG